MVSVPQLLDPRHTGLLTVEDLGLMDQLQSLHPFALLLHVLLSQLPLLLLQHQLVGLLLHEALHRLARGLKLLHDVFGELLHLELRVGLAGVLAVGVVLAFLFVGFEGRLHLLLHGDHLVLDLLLVPDEGLLVGHPLLEVTLL